MVQLRSAEQAEIDRTNALMELKSRDVVREEGYPATRRVMPVGFGKRVGR